MGSSPFLFTAIFMGLLLSSRAKAHIPEEGMVWATVGPLVNRTIETPQGAGEVNKYYNGLGLIVEGDIDKNGGLEIGLLHLDRQYHRRHSSGDILVQRVNRLHAPIGYRHWFSRNFSGMMGFYSSYRMGDVVEVGRPASIPNDFKTSAEDKLTEYGIDFSVNWEVIHYDRYAGVIDARYSYPINEMAHESADHFTFIVGIKYLVQSKKPYLRQ